MKLLSLKVEKTGLVHGELQDAYRDPQWDITSFKFIGKPPGDVRVSVRIQRGCNHYWRTLRPDERPDVRATIACEIEKALNQRQP
jgi:hypothetical protein